MTGPHNSWADRGTDTPAASHPGIPGGAHPAMRPASRTIPRVARTERRKPTLEPNVGSNNNRAMVAQQRNDKARPLEPPAKAITPMQPITAALSTLGSEPTNTTKAPNPARAVAPAMGRGSLIRRARTRNPPRTRLQLAPDTAVRWVMPVTFMA